ncbi:hypothetical protein [Clostridium botulinum]|uniref:Uncharacterized protein n=1 Tax=Clostridium botulinum CFSAN001627 TaxID=1232189 RepID=M1ZV57_CLOBO|nr:hypothetical protein [Clostridium botulinum]EKN43371.1 hypothetical protein CFSAN001627_00897 [Clostridium botulinum CFSAN001627]APC82178.1 hypothetical protein NPD12_3736 [Clostridium botulinum]MBY6850386.1 hypothetical protein [Clostridium botulinum]MBY6857446.1 hypothetical protein [Clostridium botulinum]MBY6967416.1 hypothetical protein [Clostridium botulinum]
MKGNIETVNLKKGNEEIEIKGFTSGEIVSNVACSSSDSIEFEINYKLCIGLGDTVNFQEEDLKINGEIIYIQENKTDKGYKYKIDVR